jgi:predicted nucleic acid-binding Zn ribbon protein
MNISFMALAIACLIAIIILNIILMLPYIPRLITRPIVGILSGAKMVFALTTLVLCMAMYRAYIGFSRHSPFVTIDQAKSVENLSLILSRHYRHQRNFYICAFSITMLFVLYRVVALVKNTQELEEKVATLEKTK